MTRSLEAAFLADIAAHPDDDAPRLIFADWLHDHGQEERAEFLRLQCQLDPARDRFDDPAINAVRARIETLTQPYEQAERAWFGRHGIRFVWRRGFLDEVRLPVQWLVRHGEQLRARYPHLRKLTLFRLNGWGERLAACAHLAGIREIELPCWYADQDAQAVADSPHLAAVERVVIWSGSEQSQGRIFAQGTAWAGLRNLHLITAGAPAGWVADIDRVAGRAIASLYSFYDELFPFAADFHPEYFVGKLPDGTLLFIPDWIESAATEGVAFDADGTRRAERFRYVFTPELVYARPEGSYLGSGSERERQVLQARRDHLRTHLGFEPAFIRVRGFSIHNDGTGRILNEVEDRWGREDDPGTEPEADRDDPRGNGGDVFDWVSSGSFVYYAGNTWWCDRSGHVTAT